MALDGLSGLERSRPWLAPWQPWLAHVLPLLHAGHGVASALNFAAAQLKLGATGVRFVPQSEMPKGVAYEAFIAETACVPTRDNLHDLFNGLCWLRFAALKRRLNALQASELNRLGMGPTRGPVRDALTLLDENAVLIQGPTLLHHALRRRQWQDLFIAHRALWSHTRLNVFGHALLEKLLQPYKSITAHVVWIDDETIPASTPEESESLGTRGDHELEHMVLQRLTPSWLAGKPFLPLPVLGLPGWSADNTQPEFYRDTQVFRPAPIPTVP